MGSCLFRSEAWPDVRPANAWCLPQALFVPHIDRIMAILGLPVESRTAMITGWLPSITRHKNVVSMTRSFLSSNRPLTLFRHIGMSDTHPTRLTSG